MPHKTATPSSKTPYVGAGHKWLRRFLSYAERDSLTGRERAAMLRAQAAYVHAVTGCHPTVYELFCVGISPEGGIAVYDRPAGEDGYRPVAIHSPPGESGRRRVSRSGFTPLPAPQRAAEHRPGQSRPRARGAGRPKGQATRASTQSGDRGSEDGEPEPPGARTCEWCGRGIEHLNKDARHCSPKHRVYAQRARDRANPDRVADRSAARQRAERQPRSSASGPCPGPKATLGRCGATLVSKDPEGGVWCVLCGTPRSPLTSPNGLDAIAVEMMQFDKFTMRMPAPREWRTRPSRSEAARLRKTRRNVTREDTSERVAR
jgi:hypothetical protein